MLITAVVSPHLRDYKCNSNSRVKKTPYLQMRSEIWEISTIFVAYWAEGCSRLGHDGIDVFRGVESFS